jgi:hypothetical protein
VVKRKKPGTAKLHEMPLLRYFAASLRRRFSLQLSATLEQSATVDQHPLSHISHHFSHGPPSAFRRYHEAKIGRDGHFPETTWFS